MAAGESRRLAVLGAGAWGTALASALARNGHAVHLWGRDAAVVEAINARGENPRYLPGCELPAGIRATTDLTAAACAGEGLILAVPSYAFRELLRTLAMGPAAARPFIWACKGVEPETHLLLHEVVAAERSEDAPAHGVISGPSFAREVVAGLPTALTVASRDADFATRVVDWFHGGGIRAYSNPDLIGVELGGALKNVLAIACGAADGLGFGANARAAVITRGLNELMRLGEAMGARRETLIGLAGLGDLVLTCTDDQSRNRRFGLAIARGLDVDAASAEIGQAVEGLRTARAAAALARDHNVDMPIVESVDAVLHAGLAPREAVTRLLERVPKAEVPSA